MTLTEIVDLWHSCGGSSHPIVLAFLDWLYHGWLSMPEFLRLSALPASDNLAAGECFAAALAG